MKQLKSLVLSATLICALSAVVYGGDMGSPGVSTSGDMGSPGVTTSGDMGSPGITAKSSTTAEPSTLVTSNLSDETADPNYLEIMLALISLIY